MFAWIDLKFSVRLLLKKPIFTATSVLIVALGLALTLFCWTLLQTLIFSPLQFSNNSPIYAIERPFDVQHARRNGAAAIDYAALKQERSLIAALGVYLPTTAIAGAGDSSAVMHKFNASLVDWQLFSFTGVKPLLGRGLVASDHHEGAEPVLVLSYDAWQQLFQGESSAIDQSIQVDTVSRRVIGVMPAGFSFPDYAQLWLPLPQTLVSPTIRDGQQVFAYAQLQPGVTLVQLNDFLDRMALRVKAELTEDLWWLIPSSSNTYLQAMPYKQANADVRHYLPVFMSMLVVVLLILLLASINIGNLLLSRVNERWKEVAIRIALGAPSRRLVMQMLWESILICVLGGILALLITLSVLEQANQALVAMFAVNQLQPFWWQLALDGAALALLGGTVLLMILVTGFIPAWRALHGDFNAVLRDGSRGAQSQRAALASRALVISEILLSCVVLLISFVLLATSTLAGKADYGVQVEQRLTAQIDLPSELYPLREDPALRPIDLQKRSDFYHRLKAHLEQQPDVAGVILMTELPGRGEGRSYFEIEGRPAAVYEENPYTNNEAVSLNSWQTIGMRVVQGRDFQMEDISAAHESILVNEHIARDFFPAGDAIGSRVRRVTANGNAAPWRTIVGVVSNTHHGSTMNTTSAQYNSYQLIERRSPDRFYLAMHYQGAETQAKRNLQQVISEVDPAVAAYHIQPYQHLIDEPNLLISYLSQVFIICGVIAAILAASGIYALASNSIVQKTKEIGVRRALGASDANIRLLFLRQAGWQLMIGLSVGLLLSWLLIDVISQSMRLHATSLWLGTLVVPAAIIAVVLLATWLPVARVIAKEPAVALHQE